VKGEGKACNENARFEAPWVMEGGPPPTGEGSGQDAVSSAFFLNFASNGPLLFNFFAFRKKGEMGASPSVHLSR